MKTLIVAVALAALSLSPSVAQKPAFMNEARSAGIVTSLTRTGSGGCILVLRVKHPVVPPAEDYAPLLSVWIPAKLAESTKTIGHWCEGVQLQDWISVVASPDGWSCGPDYCGRSWVYAVLLHLRPVESARRNRRDREDKPAPEGRALGRLCASARHLACHVRSRSGS